MAQYISLSIHYRNILCHFDKYLLRNLNISICISQNGSVARRPPASEEGGIVALSQMPTFLAVEQKNFYGDIVTLCLVTCENVGTLVTTRDEKTAPPIIAE